jgi:hypothetical protein
MFGQGRAVVVSEALIGSWTARDANRDGCDYSTRSRGPGVGYQRYAVRVTAPTSSRVKMAVNIG